MTSRNEMMLDIKSFLTDTYSLGPTERWAYLAVLMQMHLSNDGWIDDNDAALVRLTGIKAQHWPRVRHALEPFLVIRGGKLSQKRILRDRQRLTVEPCSTSNPRSESLGKTAAHIESNPLTLRLPSKEESRGESVSAVSKRDRAHRIPADWKLTEQDREYAIAKGLQPDRIAEMAEHFFAHHRSSGKQWMDWHLCWVKWCLNELKWNGKRNGGSDVKKVGIIDAWDRLSRAVERGEDNASGQGSLLSISDRSVR